MSIKEQVSERKLVEDYLHLYCIEELIDEALNEICEKRPANPYVELARLIEAKTLPEIIDVKLR
jgi:phosphoribosylformylglycinamidine (FGAM) synthase PurS component